MCWKRIFFPFVYVLLHFVRKKCHSPRIFQDIIVGVLKEEIDLFNSTINFREIVFVVM